MRKFLVFLVIVVVVTFATVAYSYQSFFNTHWKDGTGGSSSFSFGYVSGDGRAGSANGVPGVYYYGWFTTPALNEAGCTVTQCYRGEIVRQAYFGPGGGFSDYIAFDSMYVSKGDATDLCSAGGAW